MAISKFILQGFTPRTHIEAVKRLFEISDLEQVILSVAFANEGGVELVAEQIEPVGDNVTAFVGIRNAITSKQGLARLLELGVKLFVVDTGSPNILYHPKLYFARGADEARIVIGSANLTAGGLNNNVEASVAVDLDLTNDADCVLVEEIENEFDQSLTKFPNNILAIQTAAEIQDLHDTGRLLDESVIRLRNAANAAQNSANAQNSTGSTIPVIKLLVPPIRPTPRTGVRPAASGSRPPAAAAPGAAVPGTAPAAPATPPVPAAPAAPTAPAWSLVWRSGALSERDLNIPTGSNTAVTGSMLFKQGRWSGIDQRHYFRDEVFGDLDWTPDPRPSRAHLERARATFGIIVDGVDHGEYALRLTHNSDTTSRAYEQSNSMTQVHWEGVTDIIKDRALLGKSMTLSRDENDTEHFLIEIS